MVDLTFFLDFPRVGRAPDFLQIETRDGFVVVLYVHFDPHSEHRGHASVLVLCA